MSPEPGSAPAAQAVAVVQPPTSAALLAAAAVSVGGVAAAVIAVITLIALFHKYLMRDVRRDIGDVRRDVGDIEHKANNVKGRVDALEHARTADIERIVKVEASLVSVDKALDRVDRTINERFDQLAESIREVRVVAPR